MCLDLDQLVPMADDLKIKCGQRPFDVQNFTCCISTEPFENFLLPKRI